MKFDLKPKKIKNVKNVKKNIEKRLEKKLCQMMPLNIIAIQPVISLSYIRIRSRSINYIIKGRTFFYYYKL